MTRYLAVLISGFALIGVLPPEADAAGLPIILSTNVNYSNGTLTITGQNFGDSPVVTLDTTNFPTLSATASQIVASFPAGSPPSSFAPGTYFLTLQYRGQFPSLFTVDMGAVGPRGPQGVAGPAGSQGPQGIQGLAGAPGAGGPMGAPGPIGPTGAPGMMGATGAQGVQGPQGLAGLTGATGPQGPAGANGTNGTGVPICTAPSTFLVLGQGTLSCQARFNVNGDGTLTDNQTGLMWELKSVAGTGDVHDVTNSYTWSGTLSAPDGTLYTVFLSLLNSDVSSNGGSTCFANHCDWRLPNVAELRSIVETSASNCGSGALCIDPALGPTQGDGYWSSTTTADCSFCAWITNFNFALTSQYEKPYPLPARAVRSVR